ncbi:hypothetical protein [Acinetobacter silvestris]|uniref:WG repeat-containing protein n=1 Tax=Acinetobacter silvestris TaxID=1977882 RepID=A0A1Y3CA19_9GAMM|nr:hypothetical protein [Acinetobacter silvestris]OTG63869.1 hypothetical protein B9T28_12855 [Acinetobacter silvestris]
MFRFFLYAVIFFNIAGCYAKNDFTITINGNKNQCKFDYGEIDFCSKKYLNLYNKNLGATKNFNKDFILFSLDDAIVVLDPIGKEVFPLYGQYFDEKNDGGKVIKNKTIDFSSLNNKICIDGMKYAYKDIVENGRYCYKFSNKKFTLFNEDKRSFVQKDNIKGLHLIEKELSTVESVKLPFDSKVKIGNRNVVLASNISDGFIDYVVSHGGSLGVGNAIIKLPRQEGNIVFVEFFTDESEKLSYVLNTFNSNGKGHFVNFGTGSDFYIDSRYNIKVKSYNGKNLKYNYYKIANDGTIMKGSAPFL